MSEISRALAHEEVCGLSDGYFMNGCLIAPMNLTWWKAKPWVRKQQLGRFNFKTGVQRLPPRSTKLWNSEVFMSSPGKRYLLLHKTDRNKFRNCGFAVAHKESSNLLHRIGDFFFLRALSPVDT